MDESSLRFLGRYELLPERCTAADGAPVPARATYVLELRGELVRIFVAWRSADGVERWATYGGALDGQKHPDPNPPVTHVRYTVVDGDTLDSEAYVGEQVVATARRRCVAGGAELEVVQETRRDDGTTARSVQVYRRVDV